MKLLDLFCKQGGCSMGYSLAGFDVVGVDKDFQPLYPFDFFESDALDYLKKHGHKYDVIHASPPCQAYSNSTAQHRKNKTYVDLLADTRDVLNKIGKPWVIENVPGAPMIPHLKLSGQMFGLKVVRWRWFELSDDLFVMNPYPPAIKKGIVRDGEAVSVFGNGSYRRLKNDSLPVFKLASVEATWRYAMGIDWMNRDGLREAIPPAYTEWIGNAIFQQVKSKLLINDCSS